MSALTAKGSNEADCVAASAWGDLEVFPPEIVAEILDKGDARLLSVMQCLNTTIGKSDVLQWAIRQRIEQTPRIETLEPCKEKHESPLAMLHFIKAQATAAAQGTSLSFGQLHSAALLVRSDQKHCDENGKLPHKLYTWGRGFHGQLGRGEQPVDATLYPRSVDLGFRPYNEEMEEETMTAVVSCGQAHTAVISRRGEVFSFGAGTSGETGHGPRQNGNTMKPTMVQTFHTPHTVPQRVVSIACGAHHTLAISEKNEVMTCGKGVDGQLGHGDNFDIHSMCYLASISTSRIISCAAGKAHSMALASDGSVFVWGCPSQGQLGLETFALHMRHEHQRAEHLPRVTRPHKIKKLDPSELSHEDRITSISCGDNHSFAVSCGGKLLAWGSNDHGQLGLGDRVNRWTPEEVPLGYDYETEHVRFRAVHAQAGERHTGVIVSQGGRMVLRMCGNNAYGQLGLGHTDMQSRLEPVKWLSKRGIVPVAVTCGHWHTGTVSEDRVLHTWGRGDWGQLGSGEDKGSAWPLEIAGFKVVDPARTLRRKFRASPTLRLRDPRLRAQMAAKSTQELPTPDPADPAVFQQRQLSLRASSTGVPRPMRGPLDRFVRRTVSTPANFANALPFKVRRAPAARPTSPGPAPSTSLGGGLACATQSGELGPLSLERASSHGYEAPSSAQDFSGMASARGSTQTLPHLQAAGCGSAEGMGPDAPGPKDSASTHERRTPAAARRLQADSANADRGGIESAAAKPVGAGALGGSAQQQAAGLLATAKHPRQRAGDFVSRKRSIVAHAPSPNGLISPKDAHAPAMLPAMLQAMRESQHGIAASKVIPMGLGGQNSDEPAGASLPRDASRSARHAALVPALENRSSLVNGDALGPVTRSASKGRRRFDIHGRVGTPSQALPPLSKAASSSSELTANPLQGKDPRLSRAQLQSTQPRRHSPRAAAVGASNAPLPIRVEQLPALAAVSGATGAGSSPVAWPGSPPVDQDALTAGLNGRRLRLSRDASSAVPGAPQPPKRGQVSKAGSMLHAAKRARTKK